MQKRKYRIKNKTAKRLAGAKGGQAKGSGPKPNSDGKKTIRPYIRPSIRLSFEAYAWFQGLSKEEMADAIEALYKNRDLTNAES